MSLVVSVASDPQAGTSRAQGSACKSLDTFSPEPGFRKNQKRPAKGSETDSQQSKCEAVEVYMTLSGSCRTRPTEAKITVTVGS